MNNRYYLRVVIFLFALLGSEGIKAQYSCSNNTCTDSACASNLYWFYRHRLTNYFMCIGMGDNTNVLSQNIPGQSIPADIRNYNGNGLNWGDDGRTMGWYIGMLATEHYLLKKRGANANENEMELFYALHALFRLDSMGIMMFINVHKTIDTTLVPSGDKNPVFPGSGYMYSDDVDTALFNAANPGGGDPNAPVTGSGIVGPVTNFFSGYIDSSNYTSQDNYYAALMGLALTVELLDSLHPVTSFIDTATGHTIYFGNTYGDLRSMAQKLGLKICYWFFNGQFSNYCPDGTFAPGGQFTAIAYPEPLEDMADHIFNGDSCSNIGDLNPPACFLWSNYSLCNVISQSCAVPLFQNIEMGMELAALSNDTGAYHSAAEMIKAFGNYSANIGCSAGQCSLNCQTVPANQYGMDLCWESIHQILYPDTANLPYINLPDMLEIIYSAPPEGPFAHSLTDYATCDWASDKRFVQQPPLQSTPRLSNPTTFFGNYNGLDYMLFYNLYCIMAQPGGFEGAQNITDEPACDAIRLYPNPFTKKVIFQMEIKETTPVTISIYNAMGEKARDFLQNQVYNQGNYTLNFDGSALASGVYIAVIQTNEAMHTLKLIKE